MSMTIFSRETELNAVFAVHVAWLLLLQNRLFIIEFWLGRQVAPPVHAMIPCIPVPGLWLYPIHPSHLPPVVPLMVLTLTPYAASRLTRLCSHASYSSASWLWPCPPSCSAAPGPSVLPPDHIIVVPPEFHQLLPFSITARKSISKLAGRFWLIAVFTADVLQFARRLELSPQQPNLLEPQIGVDGIRSTQILMKLRYLRYGCAFSLKRLVAKAARCLSSVP